MNKPHCQNSPIIRGLPQAAAVLDGSDAYPEISGIVRFYRVKNGTLVYADVSGLPHDADPCSQQVFAFHIHGGDACTGNAADPFADAGSHYDPGHCRHPFHAGDMPPLFGNHGRAVLVFLTNRFDISEILEKTVIIHKKPDDFSTQPSGNAGEKIACGIIRRVAR